MALYEGWQQRRVRELRDLAVAFNVAQSENPQEAIAAAFPDPEPLTGPIDDEWDRSRWW